MMRDLTRLLACLMLTTGHLLAGEDAVWRVPPDAAWELIAGTGTVAATADGWVWDARPADQGGQLAIRLPVDLAGYHEIRFEYKPTHGPVQVMVTTDGYPGAHLSRNWYDKNIQQLDAWNSVALELDLDDDGRPTEHPESQDLWLRFGFAEDSETVRDDRRRVEFRNIRLVRHPVEWKIDYFRTRTRYVDDRLEVSYPITLRNRSDLEVQLGMRFDRDPPRTGKSLFALPTETSWTLGPPSEKSASFGERWGGGVSERNGDAIGTWITFTAPAGEARKRPPLWTEMVWPRLEVDGYDEPLLPLHSSRLDPWFLTVPPPALVHPVVEATPAKLRRAWQRNARPGRFAGRVDGLLAQAKRLLTADWSLPRQITMDGEAFNIHARNGQRALDLARAWSLTGDSTFRDGAIEVLQAYADNYLLWEPLRESSTAFTSRTMTSTLMEGFRMWPFYFAWDYLRPSLDPAQVRDIEERFLLPLARSLDGHVLGYNNQLTQHQHNVFFFAVTTENWPLAMRYVEGPRGLFAMRQYGFDVDGMGMERDMGYHWNTVDPMIGQLITLDHLGWDDSALDVESLLSAPVALGVAIASSHYPFDRRYEWTYAHYGNSTFITAVGGNGLGALLHGVDRIPTGELALEPAHLKHAGYVVLRRQVANGVERRLLANYGSPHHRNHRDLLSVHVSEGGNPIIDMMGQQFGRDGWYSTLADSLLVVNGRDQLVSGRGRLVRLEQGKGWQAMEIATDPATPLYEPHIAYHRLLVDAGPFVVLLDRAIAPPTVSFQWAFYPGRDVEIPNDWMDMEAMDFLQEGPANAKMRKNWRKAPAATEQLMLTSEYSEEQPTIPITLLVSPAARPWAFETPGNRKKGWVDALLLNHGQAIGASWAAVANVNPVDHEVTLLVLIGADGRPLPDGHGTAIRIVAEGSTWTIAFADSATNARLPDGTPLEDGWLIREEGP